MGLIQYQSAIFRDCIPLFFSNVNYSVVMTFTPFRRVQSWIIIDTHVFFTFYFLINISLYDLFPQQAWVRYR
jgi:hypothetical protein